MQFGVSARFNREVIKYLADCLQGQEGGREGGGEREREEGTTQMACVGAGELVMRMACWHHRYTAQQPYVVSLLNGQQVAHTNSYAYACAHTHTHSLNKNI